MIISSNFSPLAGLLGGILIGLSAGILLIYNGRIAGVSGILAGLYTKKINEWGWRFIFMFGILFGALLAIKLGYGPATIEITGNKFFLIIGGLLVGIGTVAGNGCTTGHGICGMSRLSPRSIFATLVFMIFAIGTVFIVRHMI